MQWLLSLLAVSVIAMSGCDRSSATSQDTNGSGRPGELKLVVSGDTGGWITPCGCTSNQSGGLLRRATYLKQLAADGTPVIYADAGGAGAGTSDYQKTKFEAILRGELLMQVAAHNIGASEAAMGPDYLRDIAHRLNLPLISANAQSAAGQPIGEASRVVTAGGMRLAIVGVLSPKYATQQVRITDPRQAIAAAIAPLAGKYDALIVLAYLPEDELQQLATNVPEADAIVGGPTGQAIAPHEVGPTLLGAATNKGKFIIELTASRRAGVSVDSRPSWSGQVVELTGKYADDRAQLANVKQYLATLAASDFHADQTGLVQPLPPGAPADYRIAGSQSCASCHAPSQAIWAHSAHAHALETLRSKGFDVDPSCQQCHTTGYGLPGGFVSLKSTPAMGGVGCENCHGPSQQHVNNPTVRTPFAAADQCVRCHDHENSPTFAFAAYWPRIQHGSSSAATTRPAPAGERGRPG